MLLAAYLLENGLPCSWDQELRANEILRCTALVFGGIKIYAAERWCLDRLAVLLWGAFFMFKYFLLIASLPNASLPPLSFGLLFLFLQLLLTD